MPPLPYVFLLFIVSIHIPETLMRLDYALYELHEDFLPSTYPPGPLFPGYTDEMLTASRMLGDFFPSLLLRGLNSP